MTLFDGLMYLLIIAVVIAFIIELIPFIKDLRGKK